MFISLIILLLCCGAIVGVVSIYVLGAQISKAPMPHRARVNVQDNLTGHEVITEVYSARLHSRR